MANSLSKNLYYAKFKSPVGKLLFISDDYHLQYIITEEHYENMKYNFNIKRTSKSPILNETKVQLSKYFNGELTSFKLPIELSNGTSFQHKSWKTLLTIPYGHTISYKEQAIEMGHSKSARAVGSANGKNNLLIVVPCHRVISSSGSLGGYSAGLNIKEFLLKLETSVINKIRAH